MPNRYSKVNKGLDNIGDTVPPTTAMTEPNQSITIYEGGFELRYKDKKVSLEGRIYFDWFPDEGPKFTADVNNPGEFAFTDISEKYEVLVNDYILGECYLLSKSLSTKLTLEGMIVSTVVLGDKSVSVSKINFVVPNLRSFLGDTTKSEDEKGTVTSTRSRIRLENDDVLVLLDKLINFDSLMRSLSFKGGYIILYSGAIEPKKGSINYQDLRSLVSSISVFLSFLNGRRCSPMIIQGKHEGEVLWTDYSGYQTDQYKSVPNWPSHLGTTGINAAWVKWCAIFKDESGKDFLQTAVHWYTEANSNSGRVEGSIIMTQTALELIYNWLIIERKGILIGNDGSSITASNKIRLLLNQLGIDFLVPVELKHLTEFMDSNKDIVDGPECFVRIRNAIVHSQEEKRKLLSLIPLMARYEALQIGLWYVELALLSVLGYNGSYVNRCKSPGMRGTGEEIVPWATPPV